MMEMTQNANQQTLKDSYDYVIVGAGAAGCIVAARLADAGAEVLLVETSASKCTVSSMTSPTGCCGWLA
jgi:choline dehydrogenase-like flavoprotein